MSHMRYRDLGKARRRARTRELNGMPPHLVTRLLGVETRQVGPTPFHIRGRVHPDNLEHFEALDAGSSTASLNEAVESALGHLQDDTDTIEVQDVPSAATPPSQPELPLHTPYEGRIVFGKAFDSDDGRRMSEVRTESGAVLGQVWKTANEWFNTRHPDSYKTRTAAGEALR